MSIPALRANARLLTALCMPMLAPVAARATQGADLQVDLVDTGVDPDGASGSARLQARRGDATLAIRLRHVDSSPLHLCAGPDEAQLANHADLDASGGTLRSSDGTLAFDPRLGLVAVSAHDDCSEPLLVARLDEPTDCAMAGRVKISESAELAPGTATPPASAELRYDLLPDRNCTFAEGGSGAPLRKAKLSLRVQHAQPRTTYDVCIDEQARGSLATNAAGVGRAEFRFVPSRDRGSSNGSSRGPKHAVLDFDVYGSHVQIRDDAACGGDDATAVFFGPALAPLCATATTASADLGVPGAIPPPASPTGTAELGRDGDCGARLELRVEGLDPSQSYDVDVDPGDGATEGAGALETDGSGSGKIVFRSEPGGDELPLDFDASAGDSIEVRPAGSAAVALSGTLE